MPQGYPPAYPQVGQPQSQAPNQGAPRDYFDQMGHNNEDRYAPGAHNQLPDATESMELAPTEFSSYLLSEDDLKEQEQADAEPYEPNYEGDGQSYHGDGQSFEGEGQSYDENDEPQPYYNYDQAPPDEAEVPYAQQPTGFPSESYVGLPAQVIPQAMPQAVPSPSTASYAQLGTPLPDDVRLAADPDLADALTVLLSTIDKQIEALTRQGGEAFARRDFRQAESIVRLSERLTNFKSEALLLLEAIEPSAEED
jgi:hypothetical protein